MMPKREFNEKGKDNWLVERLRSGDIDSIYKLIGEIEASAAEYAEFLTCASEIDGAKVLGGGAFREPQPYHEFAEPGGAKPPNYDAGL